MSKGTGYYDLQIAEIEAEAMQNACIEEIFYLKDLKQRKIFISEEICQETVGEAVRHIMQMNREDIDIPPENRRPILLYISSEGGDMDSGFELIDVILNSKTPVYTINFGYWYSMGLLIGLAGHKRFASQHAKFLLHDGSSLVYNSGGKAQDQMKFQEQAEERVKEYILSHSKLEEEEYNRKFRVEWYMFAKEAQEVGFVDYIIGTDCDIDAVI